MQAKREPAADPLAPQYPIGSVDNALKLLLLLGERPEIRLSEATRYLGVAPSTAHRLLAMLATAASCARTRCPRPICPAPR
jgi:IclR helix-turn-helix domain